MRILLGLLIFFGSWLILSMMLSQSLILPTPMETFSALVEILRDSTTYSAMLSTIAKGFMILGLIIAVGLPVGFVMGLSDKIYELLRPTVMIIQSVPVISWLALVIFMWGIGWKGPVLIGFLSLLPISIFTIVEGVRSIDRDLLEMVKVYRVPKIKVFKYVYIGSLIPFIKAVVDVSVGNVWKTVLVTEFLCGDKGLGVMISWARQYVDVPRVYAITLMAVGLGIGTERIAKKLMSLTTRRWGM